MPGRFWSLHPPKILLNKAQTIPSFRACRLAMECCERPARNPVDCALPTECARGRVGQWDVVDKCIKKVCACRRDGKGEGTYSMLTRDVETPIESQHLRRCDSIGG